MSRIPRPSHATVVAYVALFVALTGGTTAVALSGSNTVQSDDLGPGAQVMAPDVADNAVNGADVQNGSLRQGDLGVRLRGARQVNDASPAAICGQGGAFDECVTVLFNVPRPQRLLLIGSGEWAGEFAQGGNRGECRFSVPTVGNFGLRRFAETISSPSAPFDLAMNSVTGVVAAGTYEISIDCRDTSINGGGMAVRGTELSVVALGDG
jgi:hypothetical protein